METVQAGIYSLCTLLAIAVICVATVYGCTKTNQQFNELAAKCMEAHGNWIPQNGSVNAAYYIQGRTP